MRTLPTLCAVAACLAAPAPAQVIISEVFFTNQTSGDSEWIEIRNTGSSPVDLSSWSIYLATDTPGVAQNYWFGFPANTVIGASASMTIHWMSPVQASTLTEVYTGNSIFNFLFGYGAEELGAVSNGALALLDSQSNQLMNTASVFQDWITWGNGWTEFPRPAREDLAIQVGLWTAATAVNNSSISAPIEDGQSLAIDYNKSGEPTSPTAFFRDASPTPTSGNNPLSGHNHQFAEFSVLEDPNNPGAPLQPCESGGGTAPTISEISVSASGNVDFGLRVENLVPGQLGALFLGVTTGTIPWALAPGCSVNVIPIAVCPFTVVTSTLDFPITLDAVPPGTLYIQGVTLLTLNDMGFDPGHKWVVGN